MKGSGQAKMAQKLEREENGRTKLEVALTFEREF